jgi:NADPH:quinone reductase-like Zn-dependent oxidoreductase
MAAGKLQLRVAKEFPLAEIREATTYLEGRSALGKVILSINPSLDSVTPVTAATKA